MPTKVIEKTIKIEAYTVAGKPTCATNFGKNHCCKWYYTKKFGQIPFCALEQQEIQYEDGYSIPVPTCPIWNSENV